MQDVNGKTLAVGDTVKFDVWDDGDGSSKPVKSESKGTITALDQFSREDEKHGDITVQAGKETRILHPLSVRLVPAK